MKKLRNLIAVMAMMSMAAVLTGCGDDDDDDDDDGGPVGPQIVAPADEAALTAQNKTYTLIIPGEEQPVALTFPAAGQYQIVQGEVTESGTISGAVRNDNTWTMTVTPAAGQDGAQEGVLVLNFTQVDTGTFTFTPTGGAAETGSFTVQTGNGGGDDGGGDNGGDNGGGSLDSVAGKTLQLTYQPSGGERFDFGTGNTVSYENNSESGTYTYDATARRINIALTNGWNYEITLAEDGTATVVFSDASGTDTSTATYTLSGGQ